MRALYGENREVLPYALRPFTSRRSEPDVSCPICDMRGCRTCKFTGWIEMGGAGMVDPKVFSNVGIDPEEWTGSRSAVGSSGQRSSGTAFPRSRPFWENDLRVMRQF